MKILNKFIREDPINNKPASWSSVAPFTNMD